MENHDWSAKQCVCDQEFILLKLDYVLSGKYAVPVLMNQAQSQQKGIIFLASDYAS